MDELLAVVPPIFRLAAQKSNPPDHTFNLSLCHQCAAHPRFWSQREHFFCQILQLLHILHMLHILQIKHLLHIFVFCISYIQPVTLPPMCCTPKIFVIDVAFIVFVFAYFVQNFANAHFAYVDNPADLASIAHFRILHIQHSTCHFAHHQCAAQ